MEKSNSLELHLIEAELETLINAVRSTCGGRFAELEYKLRAAGAVDFLNPTTVRSFPMLVERFGGFAV
jgi:hypothetical protein